MKGKRILVVEDEKDLLRLLKYNLEREGYRALTAADGEAGLEAALKERPDLVVLDVMLPKLDGLEVCRRIRQESKVPVLFLTARKSEVDRVLGLRLGGDDYVVKPFSVAELIARIEAILRRTGQEAASAPLRAGELELDPERHEVRVKGKAASLTPKEFLFLKLLMEARGKVLSRDMILERVWGYDKSMEIDTRTVDQHIARLRRKLRTEGDRIVTVTNAGYKVRMDG